ncbi:hypothetical protein D3C87_1531490 [compost metagenome]
MPNYLAPVAASHTAYHTFNATDLHFHTDGYLYAVNGSSWKIEKDGSTSYVYRRSRGTLSDFARRASDGAIWHSDRSGRLSPWTNDWESQLWGGMQTYSAGGGICVDAAGNWVSANRITHSCLLMTVGWQDGTQTTPRFISNGTSADPQVELIHDGGSRLFMGFNPAGRLMRYDTSDNSYVQIARKYSELDFSHGIALHGGILYHSIKTRHQIDRYNATTNADLGALLVGLIAPEL